jgi:outer membrane protein assembly factor BamA
MQVLDATVALVVVTAIFGATGRELGAQTAGSSARREVERVELRGVRSVPVEQVRRVLQTRASSLLRKRYLAEGALERDVAGLRDFYGRRGFREVQVDTIVRPSRHGVAVTFDVREGPPTLIDTLVVEQTTPALDTTTIARA